MRALPVFLNCTILANALSSEDSIFDTVSFFLVFYSLKAIFRAFRVEVFSHKIA